MTNQVQAFNTEGRRVTADDVLGQPLQVFDSRGGAIGRVCAFQEIPGGLRVWIYAGSPDGKQVAGISDDGLSEFVADMPGAYVGLKNA